MQHAARLRNGMRLQAHVPKSKAVASFRTFPFFVMQQREPRRGSDAWVAFLAQLFGEAKRCVAAGLPPACNRKLRMRILKI